MEEQQNEEQAATDSGQDVEASTACLLDDRERWTYPLSGSVEALAVADGRQLSYVRRMAQKFEGQTNGEDERSNVSLTVPRNTCKMPKAIVRAKSMESRMNWHTPKMPGAYDGDTVGGDSAALIIQERCNSDNESCRFRWTALT